MKDWLHEQDREEIHSELGSDQPAREKPGKRVVLPPQDAQGMRPGSLGRKKAGGSAGWKAALGGGLLLLALAVGVVCFLLRGDPIVGKWLLMDSPDSYFQFEADGRMLMSVGTEMEGLTQREAKYRTEDEKLWISGIGNATQSIPYAIQGDTLRITLYGVDLLFIRQEAWDDSSYVLLYRSDEPTGQQNLPDGK